MMPFYAPFGPFNHYNYRRADNYYSPYNNLHNSNLNSNNLKEKPCFPSVPTKNEQGNLGHSSNNNNFFKNDSKNVSKNNNYHPEKDNNYYNNNKNEYLGDFNNNFFEIFGLKLAFDDLLIIAMLFFLYKEEVNDTYLYIALILLLLT